MPATLKGYLRSAPSAEADSGVQERSWVRPHTKPESEEHWSK
jgi:hypothetical protein